MLAHVLKRSRAWILAHPEYQLDAQQVMHLQAALKRLCAGEPLPYVIGHWEFYGLDFEINPAVLIPRPETELLVEQALAWLNIHSEARLVADVGTGSGCIAVSIANNNPHVRVFASDCSMPALEVARRNAHRYKLDERIHFIQADLLSPIIRQHLLSDGSRVEGKLNLIAANLPYIPTQVLHQLPVYGKEPELALDGGADGLQVIQQFFIQAARRLAPRGMLLCEIEATQGASACQLARQILPDARVELLQDLGGMDRLVRVELVV